MDLLSELFSNPACWVAAAVVGLFSGWSCLAAFLPEDHWLNEISEFGSDGDSDFDEDTGSGFGGDFGD